MVEILVYAPVLFTFYRPRHVSRTPFTGLFYYVFRAAIVLFPALYFLLYPPCFWEFTVSFAILYMVLLAVYEIQYLINDYIAVKGEEKPTIRPYTKVARMEYALAVRLAIIIATAFWLKTIVFVYWLLAFGYIMVIFNLINNKRRRVWVFPSMRLVRALFCPLILSNMNKNVMFPCLIVYLPVFLQEALLQMLNVTSGYHNLDSAKFKLPFYCIFLVTLPVQLLFLWDNLFVLLGNIVNALISMVNRLWKKQPL